MAKPQPPRQRKDEEWQAALRRVLLLSPADQLRIHEALSGELGGPLWQESERSRQARLRRAALAAMAAAAAQLRLPAGTAPSIPEFKRVAGETDLPMTFSAVYEAFENRWDIASRFYRGEHVPETAAQGRFHNTDGPAVIYRDAPASR